MKHSGNQNRIIIERPIDFKKISSLMNQFPVTAIVGARQIGKTTLAKRFQANHYFDLEYPPDLIRFDNPLLTLEDLKGLIVIDEIQRKPDIFPLLRALVDRNPDQKYLILGSASKELIKQSSESLAGRIAYYKLEGFRLSDIGIGNWKKLWLRGGLPRSFIAENDSQSFTWRQQYLQTFLERDIPQLGIQIPAQTLHRFWMMLSHYHGQLINYSEIGKSFGISDINVRKYIDILENTFMVKTLWPWHTNLKKRLVKRPKLYFTDTGILHSLLTIETMEQLQTHPKLGSSWEGFAMRILMKMLDKDDSEFFFWRTHAGAELDLFWQSGGQNFGAEFKYMDAPKLTKSMKIAISDLNLSSLFVIYPGKVSYKLSEKVKVFSLADLVKSGIE